MEEGLSESLGADEAPEQAAEAEPVEEASTLRERAFWALMGLGCTWTLNDSMFLQIPYWVSSQAEGLHLPNRIALSGSVIPPLATATAMVLRKYRYEQMQRYCVPTVICFSLVAGSILGWPLGLWRVSSWFIYLSMALVACVGNLSTFVTIPWILSEGYKPVLISSIFFGGSCGSLSASTLALLVQKPGSEKNFDPTVFFTFLTVPVIGAMFAFFQIRAHGIGKKSEDAAGAAVAEDGEEDKPPTEPDVPPPLAEEVAEAEAAPAKGGCQRLTRAVPREWDAFLPSNWRRWIGSAWPLATWLGVVAMCTWTVSRAVMGFGTAHTVRSPARPPACPSHSPLPCSGGGPPPLPPHGCHRRGRAGRLHQAVQPAPGPVRPGQPDRLRGCVGLQRLPQRGEIQRRWVVRVQRGQGRVLARVRTYHSAPLCKMMERNVDDRVFVWAAGR